MGKVKGKRGVLCSRSCERPQQHARADHNDAAMLLQPAISCGWCGKFTAFFAAISIHQNDQFAKTNSGQTSEKLRTQQGFSAGLCTFYEQGPPELVENVGAAAIAAPHDWALVNHGGGRVSVAVALPKGGAGPSSASVVLPRLETLLSGAGVAHVRFTGKENAYLFAPFLHETIILPRQVRDKHRESTPKTGVSSGLAFEYATWLRPGQGDGFVDFQGGACMTGRKESNQNCSEDQGQVVTPGNLPFRASTDVVFSGCRFGHLGASAVEFSNGAQHCVVRERRFALPFHCLLNPEYLPRQARDKHRERCTKQRRFYRSTAARFRTSQALQCRSGPSIRQM